MAISVKSLSTVSLIAMVPDSECRTPTLIVSAATVGVAETPSQHDSATDPAKDVMRLMNPLRCVILIRSLMIGFNENSCSRHRAVTCVLALRLSHDPCHTLMGRGNTAKKRTRLACYVAKPERIEQRCAAA